MAKARIFPKACGLDTHIPSSAYVKMGPLPQEDVCIFAFPRNESFGEQGTFCQHPEYYND